MGHLISKLPIEPTPDVHNTYLDSYCNHMSSIVFQISIVNDNIHKKHYFLTVRIMFSLELDYPTVNLIVHRPAVGGPLWVVLNHIH